ncbi:MAG: hypothetical protein M3069_22225 [Chloroflexota bacterium]|nr:hypothetical protein [Chloroflexota bacterium]
MARLVTPTLGPTAGTVVVDSLVSTTPEILDSGAIIARRTIQLPDPFEDMGAMLLRNVLLTVFDRTGDGTATTAVLTRSLVHALDRYISAGGNIAQLERGLQVSLDIVVASLCAMARPIEGAEAVANVAAGAVRDQAIARIIGQILDATGPDGSVVVEDSDATDTTYEYLDGIRWNAGLASEAFLDSGQTSVRLIEPRICVTDSALEQTEQLQPVLEACVAGGVRRLFVVAPEIRDPIVALLAVNHQHGVFEGVAAVRAPSTGDTRAAILADLAVATGGRLLQAAAGGTRAFKLSDLGSARQAWATRQAFGIVGGRGSRSTIRDRVAEARAELSRAHDDVHLRNMTQQRIGKLLGLGALIRVGAPSQLARDELHVRTDAALRSARLALEDGVVPGGGATLVALADVLCERKLPGEQGIAASILGSALRAPMFTIARNAGCIEPGAIVEDARRRGPGWTFDTRDGIWVDAWQAGIVDPTAVVRAALQASVSAARLAMATGALIRTRQAPPPSGR